MPTPTTTILDETPVTVTVPARTIDRLRDEVFVCIHEIAGHLDALGRRPGPEEIRLQVATLSQLTALMDEIGWDFVNYYGDHKQSAEDTVEITAGRLALREVADYTASGADAYLSAHPIDDEDRAVGELLRDLATRLEQAAR